jgi:hypothetical protein
MTIAHSPRIVINGLIYANDAGNTKSYSGVGTAIKNLVGYGATNTAFNQTFVSSGTTSYFTSTSSTSYISNTNVSVSASTGRGFTICMMVKPQTLTSSGWNYWFQQESSITSVQFGRYGTSNGWQMKDSAALDGEEVLTTVGTRTWTVPVGVTSVTAVCVGGGGGGGGVYGGGSGGGGGGGVSYGSFSVTPGDTLYIRVGSGGVGGLSVFSTTNGTSGQSSYIKTVSHSGTSLLEGGGGNGGGSGSTGSPGTGGSGGSSTGTARSGGTSGGTGGTGAGLRSGGGGGAGGYGTSGAGGGNGGGGSSSSEIQGGSGTTGGGGGGGNTFSNTDSEVNNYGGGVGISDGTRLTGVDVPGGVVISPGSSNSGGGGGSASTSGSNSVAAIYGGGGGTTSASVPSGAFYDSRRRNGGTGGQGAVRIVWGYGRNFANNTSIGSSIPSTQTVSFSDWTFVVFGVTTNYYTFISTNASTKTLGSLNDWNNSDEINLDKIFGTGTSNYDCLWNNVMIYNRELTNDEIQINFEAYRRKFNL